MASDEEVSAIVSAHNCVYQAVQDAGLSGKHTSKIPKCSISIKCII